MTGHFTGSSRRAFMKHGALGALAAFRALAQQGRKAGGGNGSEYGGYGALVPVNDQNTGLPLLRLPNGFRYTSFGWTGDLMNDGTPTPNNHDGMGVAAVLDGGRLVLVRNHEIKGQDASFAKESITYDPVAPSGTTSLLFDTTTGQLLRAMPSLGGTSVNCAGGPTPWRSWLTCEETTKGVSNGFEQEHGWVFEVPALGSAAALPITDMGRFAHEAVAIDPTTGFAYLTEDDTYTSGFYRFRAQASPSELASRGFAVGGVLEMLKVVGRTNADLQGARLGTILQVEWVTIDDPSEAPRSGVGPFVGYSGQTTRASGPFVQGFDKGAARFHRLEGAASYGGLIYFVDTAGGQLAPDSGQPEGVVWCYEPAKERLVALYTSPSKYVLENPDNITVSPRGGILLCEDGGTDPERLLGLTPTGGLFEFAANNVVLNGTKGIVGDFRHKELAGTCFDPSGTWLFVNLFDPGITFAITGPWHRGAL